MLLLEAMVIKVMVYKILVIFQKASVSKKLNPEPVLKMIQKIQDKVIGGTTPGCKKEAVMTHEKEAT